MNRLFYWAITMVGLTTGVFLVLKSSLGLPDSNQSEYMDGRYLHQRDKVNHGRIKVQEKSIPFVAPVENPGIVRKLEHKGVVNNHGTRHVLKQEHEVKPVIEPWDSRHDQPNLPKTNMRKLDQVRNYSKADEEFKRQRQSKVTQNLNYDDDILYNKLVNKSLHRKPSDLKLEDIFIGVKTTTRYHSSRLGILVKTWFQNAKHQVSFTF